MLQSYGTSPAIATWSHVHFASGSRSRARYPDPGTGYESFWPRNVRPFSTKITGDLPNAPSFSVPPLLPSRLKCVFTQTLYRHFLLASAAVLHLKTRAVWATDGFQNACPENTILLGRIKLASMRRDLALSGPCPILVRRSPAVTNHSLRVPGSNVPPFRCAPSHWSRRN